MPALPGTDRSLIPTSRARGRTGCKCRCFTDLFKKFSVNSWQRILWSLYFTDRCMRSTILNPRSLRPPNHGDTESRSFLHFLSVSVVQKGINDHAIYLCKKSIYIFEFNCFLLSRFVDRIQQRRFPVDIPINLKSHTDLHGNSAGGLILRVDHAN